MGWLKIGHYEDNLMNPIITYGNIKTCLDAQRQDKDTAQQAHEQIAQHAEVALAATAPIPPLPILLPEAMEEAVEVTLPDSAEVNLAGLRQVHQCYTHQTRSALLLRYVKPLRHEQHSNPIFATFFYAMHGMTGKARQRNYMTYLKQLA